MGERDAYKYYFPLLLGYLLPKLFKKFFHVYLVLKKGETEQEQGMDEERGIYRI